MALRFSVLGAFAIGITRHGNFDRKKSECALPNTDVHCLQVRTNGRQRIP
jgi:hypothetical protein